MELGIALRHRYEEHYDFFRRTLMELAVSYLAISVVALVLVNVLLQYYRVKILSTEIDPYFGSDPRTQQLLTQLSERLEQMTWFISLGIIVLAFVFTVLMLSRALRPIRNALYAQKRFIAHAAHELRTPLSIMKTNSEVALLDVGSLSREDITQTLQDNVAEIDRMAHTIENLLTLANFNDEGLDIPFSTVHMNEVIAQAIILATPHAKHKNITIELARLDRCIVWGNSYALSEMVGGLLHNAIRFTPDGGLIIVSLKNRDTIAELHIQDTGVGIRKNDIAHVFDPFYRTREAHTYGKDEVGAGLGLTIVQGIVARHRGKIFLSSIEGKGTSVTVNLHAIESDRSLAQSR